MMNIGGLQKNSLIDYPGKLSSVIFFAGCNFDCPYCHNPELVRESPDARVHLAPAEVYDFLQQRKGFLDAVVLSGGEPTLQAGDLRNLCQTIKQMGYPVKLDTNGSRPRVIEDLIAEGLLDYVAMDIKTIPQQYPFFIKIGWNPDPIYSSIRIIKESGIDHEFRTTCVKPLVTAPIIESISWLIQGSDLYALQRFRNREVLHPEFFQDNESHYSEDELSGFKAIAERWVEKCIIR